MALKTKCKFYFGVIIEQDNNIFDFDDGGGEISAAIPVGEYSPQQFALLLQASLNASGSQTYSCVFNRVTKKIVISATSNFSILIHSGAHTGSTFYKNIGFTGSIDLTGANSYTSDDVCCLEYAPQFYLLDYTPLEHNIKSVKASINETGSGNVEVIRFGTKRMMECSIEFITNQVFNNDSAISTNINAVENTLIFMGFLIKKSIIEFMQDKSDTANYQTLMLESTESDQSGVGFKLVEMSEYGSGFYKTGKLIFREVTL